MTTWGAPTWPPIPQRSEHPGFAGVLRDTLVVERCEPAEQIDGQPRLRTPETLGYSGVTPERAGINSTTQTASGR